MARSLIADGRATSEQAENLIEAMQRTFWDAEIPELLIAALEPAMTVNDVLDRLEGSVPEFVARLRDALPDR